MTDKPAPPVLTKPDPAERSRTYYFPNGGGVTLKNVTALLVRPSGTHRLVADGKLWIIPAGWTAIEIDADGWTAIEIDADGWTL